MIIVRTSRASILYLLERWLGLNGRSSQTDWPRAEPRWRVCLRTVAVGVIQGMIGEPLVHLLKLAADSVDGCAMFFWSLYRRSISRDFAGASSKSTSIGRSVRDRWRAPQMANG